MKRSIETTPDLQGMGRPWSWSALCFGGRRFATIGVLHQTDQGKLEIYLYGDLAGILSLAANYNGRREPNHSNERWADLVQETKVVAEEMKPPTVDSAANRSLKRSDRHDSEQCV